MRSFKLTFLAGAMAAMVAGAATAEDTYVPGYDYGHGEDRNIFTLTDKSGNPTPIRASTQDVGWDGSGSVTIPFNSSSRGTAWVVIYETGNSATGNRGPGGAWQRYVAQDLYVATVPPSGQPIEAGDNSITWDGNDFEGNAAGAGTYEFDVVVVNNLDPLTLVGPGTGPSGFTRPNIDLTQDPVEIFVQEYERSTDYHTIGDMIRATIGTDYLANPTAFERWSYSAAMPWEGARTLSGLKQDDVDLEVFWSNEYKDPDQGIYKLRINRPSKSWDLDTDWADNGRSHNTNGDRILEMVPKDGVLYQTLHGVQEVPFSAVEVRDKANGETMQAFDLGDFYHVYGTDDDGNETVRSGGPRQIDVQGDLILTSAWGHQAIVGMDRNSGEVLWVNENGDGYGDRLSIEAAAAIGGVPSPPINITGSSIDPGTGGKISFFNMVGVNGPTTFGVVGRDGSGILAISFPVSWGRFRPGGTRFNATYEGEGNGPGGGAYDGLYSTCGLRLIDHEGGRGVYPSEAKYGPGMLLHTPYTVASAKLGEGVGTVVEAVDGAGTPDSYALGAAYPNPFNPETTIEFNVPSDGFVKIEVFNTAGQLVVSLVDEELSAGSYRTTWDAVDLSGKQVSSGVYFYRMQAGDFAATHSMTLLK